MLIVVSRYLNAVFRPMEVALDDVLMQSETNGKMMVTRWQLPINVIMLTRPESTGFCTSILMVCTFITRLNTNCASSWHIGGQPSTSVWKKSGLGWKSVVKLTYQSMTCALSKAISHLVWNPGSSIMDVVGQLLLHRVVMKERSHNCRWSFLVSSGCYRCWVVRVALGCYCNTQ